MAFTSLSMCLADTHKIAHKQSVTIGIGQSQTPERMRHGWVSDRAGGYTCMCLVTKDRYYPMATPGTASACAMGAPEWDHSVTNAPWDLSVT
ncbi:MAG: hypothetical protein NXH70_02110 [Hyphomonas sp.]|nr:hypothetical protein [Hyphomonas sp.]